MRKTIAILALVGLATIGSSALAGADPSPVPDLTLSCEDGASVMTIQWPVGVYGQWAIHDPIRGTVSGPGGTFAQPTTEVVPVPDGFSPAGGTITLGTGGTNDVVHLTPTGSACPGNLFEIDLDCGTNQISLAATGGGTLSGLVDYVVIVDPATNQILAFESYNPAQPISQVSLGPISVGPNVTEVSVAALVNGASVVETYPLGDCAPTECTWTSIKEFSNVIVQYADGTEVKFDNLSGHEFSIPNDPDNPIVAVWIKAGRDRVAAGDPHPLTFHNNGTGPYHAVEDCELDPT